MEKLTLEQITAMQKQYGLTELQDRINTGLAWKLEGSYGRAAMDSLNSGACMLPEKRHMDFYGNVVPARTDLKPESTGSLENSQAFWQKVNDGEIDMGEDVEEEVM
jgi:hypothetical protein